MYWAAVLVQEEGNRLLQEYSILRLPRTSSWQKTFHEVGLLLNRTQRTTAFLIRDHDLSAPTARP